MYLTHLYPVNPIPIHPLIAGDLPWAEALVGFYFG
jgi:hypothetical protein